MRILGSVVAPSAALMAFCDSKVTGCGGIRSQLICDELVWDKAIFLQKVAHQFKRGTLFLLLWTNTSSTSPSASTERHR
jgi:hypothetical protein